MKVSDEELKRIAVAAQQHPPLSAERKKELTKLVEAILLSNELWCPYKHESQFFQDARTDAVQDLLLYICENIEEYAPEGISFRGWVVMLLSSGFLNKVTSQGRKNHVIELPTRSDLEKFVENIALVEEPPSLVEKLRECIESDPEGLFTKQRIKNSSVNFRILLKRRMAGQKWREISADLGIEISTLSTFYERCTNKLIKDFKRYLTE